jgi:hypothetical protein
MVTTLAMLMYEVVAKNVGTFEGFTPNIRMFTALENHPPVLNKITKIGFIKVIL